jgi:hypothetical protein
MARSEVLAIKAAGGFAGSRFGGSATASFSASRRLLDNCHAGRAKFEGR